MRITILLVAGLLLASAHAQITNGCFTIGGPETDQSRAVVQTSDGGYAFAGSYFYLLKADANSTVQWSNSYPNSIDPNGSGGTDMIQTSDDGFAIVGTSTSISMGLVKLDAAGAVQWSRRYDTSTDAIDDPHAVVQTPDGGYLLAGSGNVAVTGGENMLLIKTDAAGGIEWSKAYEIDFGMHEAYDVVVALDGGYALCGYHETSGGNNSFQVMRLDDNGNVLWAKGYGDGQEYATAMAATPDSGFVVVGRTNTYGYAYFGGTGWYHDGFAVKLDKDGGLQWAHAYGDTLNENFLSVAPTSDGGYAMCGEVMEGVMGVGTPRIYVAKCDANGELLWSQRFGYHQAQDIVECTDGGLAMACNGALLDFSNGAQFLFMKLGADGTICPDCMPEPYGSGSAAVFTPVDHTYVVYDNVATSADYIVDVLPGGDASGGCLETGIAENGAPENVITIAPNPAVDLCTVSFGNGQDTDRLELISLQGATLLSMAVNGRSQVDVPLGSFAPGTYIVRTTGDTRSRHARMVVAH